MKSATPDRTVTGNLNVAGVETFSMGIHEDAMSLVMDSLAGLYSDQWTAVLREYTTNGIDAHLMAGISRPVEVTLPNRMSPTLVIRDYGVGLSADDMREIYSQYGASTKRHSNDFNGMLGYGSKSALALSGATFNVTSVRDGHKVFATVTKTDTVPTFHVIRSEASGEPSGTTIEIPVPNGADQAALPGKAAKLYAYFEPGTVLVNGEAPKPFEYESKLDDDLFVVKRNDYSYDAVQSYIVMGNVPYPAPIEHGMTDAFGIVAKVPIGAVEIAPSREGLKLHKPVTKATIHSIEQRVHGYLKDVVQREVDDCDTAAGAVATIRDWLRRLAPAARPKAGDITFKGRAIPATLSAGEAPKNPDGTDDLTRLPKWTYVHQRSSKLSEHRMMNKIEIEEAVTSTVWVRNFTQGFTATVRKKLDHWASVRYRADGVYAPQRYILCPGDVPAFWTDDLTIIDYEADIKPIKLPRTVDNSSAGRSDGRPRGSYPSVNQSGHVTVEAGDIDTSKPLFWVRGNQWQASAFTTILDHMHPEWLLVPLTANRVDKFLRDFPNAVRVETAIKDAWADFKKTIPADVLKAMAAQNAGWDSLTKLDPKRISDPKVKDAIELLKVDTSATTKMIEKFRYVTTTGDLKLPNVGPNPLKRYPLVLDHFTARRYAYRDSSDASVDHLYVYMEAAYRAYSKGVLK